MEHSQQMEAEVVLAKAVTAADMELAKAKIAADAEIAKAKVAADAVASADIAKAKIVADAELAKQKIEAGDKAWNRILSLALAVVVAIPSIIVAVRVDKYHEAVNSKMDQLIVLTAKASHAEGVKEGMADRTK